MRWGPRTPLPAGTDRPAVVPVVFAVSDADLDVELTVAPDATAADLATALAGGAVASGTALVVDGTPADPDATVAELGLRAGSLLELAGPARDGHETGPAVAELRVTGGLDAGRRIPLLPGEVEIGRGEGCAVTLASPTVSARHARLRVTATGGVTVDDLGSRNGTRVAGEFVTSAPLPPGQPLQLGAVRLELAPTTPAPTPAARGRTTLDRPPRSAPPPYPAPLAVPEAPADPPPRSRLAWAAMLLPLAMGAVMAVVWDPRLALFALFSPLMVLGSWLEDRRRARRDARARQRDTAAALVAFAAAVDAAVDTERTRRLAVLPDPAEVVARATTAATTRWERRPGADDFLHLRLGTATARWQPPLATRPHRALDVEGVLRDHAVLRDAPAGVHLAPGTVVGVAGDRAAAQAIARSLVVQAAVHHGPADLRVAVFTDEPDAWSFAKWLPHARGGGEASGLRLLAAADDDIALVAAAAAATPAAACLVVADWPGITAGRPAPVRTLLTTSPDRVCGVVVTDEPSRLPACCTVIVTLDGPDGAATVADRRTGEVTGDVLVAGLHPQAAGAAARALADVDDPEAGDADASLPARVELLPLLGIDATADSVVARWRERAGEVRAPLGVTAGGLLEVDLVADGPHALVGGTTGSGKSELLRTFVVALAATASPDDLTFVLVDYKGGSAFDACARLPHTVGLVTDLDAHLGERALRCLEAELRHRERVLRDAGASDLAAYRARGGRSLPRLVVVVDEFATLAAELPDFVDSLVGIAQRGRSLGVHLVLATQRPAGVVKDNIKANTNLRIALRMQDAADSADVIDGPAAARIGRRQPGRGYARLGAGEVVAFQAALTTVRRDTAPAPAPVTVRPFRFGPAAGLASEPAERGPSDLDRLVDAIAEAAAQAGIAPPRRPWPDPLPTSVDLAALAPATIGIADEPDEQRQLALPAPAGNLLVYGVAGSGTTTTLLTIAAALARAHRPDALHLYALDFGAGGLAPLAALPHTGAVVLAAERERQVRLVRTLRAELERRRTASGPHPRVVLLLDGWTAFQSAFDDMAGLELRDDLTRIVADGPALGLSVVIAADHAGAVPLTVAALIPERLVLRLADPHDHSSFGIAAADVPPPLPGRGVHLPSGREVQIATTTDVRAGALRGRATAAPIGVLPPVVWLADLAPAEPGAPATPWSVTVGLADDTLGRAALPFHDADHAVVSGPARCGRSTALATLAAAARLAGARVVAIAPRPSPLRSAAVDVLLTDTASVVDVVGPGRHVVLVDDADALADESGALARLLADRRTDVHVVAAGRADALRAAYGHWTRELRRSRLGIALRPDPDDGDLFGTLFSRRDLPAPLPGRGFLVSDGVPRIVQVAQP